VVLEKRGLPCGSSTCSTSTRVDNIQERGRGKEGKRVMLEKRGLPLPRFERYPGTCTTGRGNTS